jgi:hypothetical protein
VSQPDDRLSPEHRFAERAFLAGYRQCGDEVKPMVDELKAKVAALQAENERLRKAGDGLMFEGETMAHEVSWNPAPWDRVVAAWVAAKEGGRK